MNAWYFMPGCRQVRRSMLGSLQVGLTRQRKQVPVWPPPQVFPPSPRVAWWAGWCLPPRVPSSTHALCSLGSASPRAASATPQPGTTLRMGCSVASYEKTQSKLVDAEADAVGPPGVSQSLSAGLWVFLV